MKESKTHGSINWTELLREELARLVGNLIMRWQLLGSQPILETLRILVDVKNKLRTSDQ